MNALALQIVDVTRMISKKAGTEDDDACPCSIVDSTEWLKPIGLTVG